MFELEAQAMLRWKKKRNYSRLELMRYLTTAHTKQKTVMLNMFNWKQSDLIKTIERNELWDVTCLPEPVILVHECFIVWSLFQI